MITGTENNVPDAPFDAANWQYNAHTHCKSILENAPDKVTNNTIPSEDKDMVGVGGKFGIILGYSRSDMGASFDVKFTNGESPNKPSFRYKREISFYNSGGKIKSIPYDDFKKQLEK